MTGKKKISFTTWIGAPREKVAALMLAPAGYEEWTQPFSEGSRYEGGWQQGQQIRFLSGSGEGMLSEIAEHRPNEYVSIRHLGMIGKDGSIDTTSDMVRGWVPAFENYAFADERGGTRVDVDMDVLPAFEDFMNETWPRALAKLKALCER